MRKNGVVKRLFFFLRKKEEELNGKESDGGSRGSV